MNVHRSLRMPSTTSSVRPLRVTAVHTSRRAMGSLIMMSSERSTPLSSLCTDTLPKENCTCSFRMRVSFADRRQCSSFVSLRRMEHTLPDPISELGPGSSLSSWWIFSIASQAGIREILEIRFSHSDILSIREDMWDRILARLLHSSSSAACSSRYSLRSWLSFRISATSICSTLSMLKASFFRSNFDSALLVPYREVTCSTISRP
mmetsp:Transcript_6375/g.14097  ORF Transcript_6375/g.14097 Transcript_6375/m.14097 type:complete len:206 (+) Transcript_6375:1334-1951(+)